MLKYNKKRILGVLSFFITIMISLIIRLTFLQVFPSEKVISQYQNHQSEKISNTNFMLLDTNGKDLMKYDKKYIVVIDQKPFSLNNYEETLEDLMALNFIMKGEISEFNYADVMKNKGKLYYTVSEDTYNKVNKLKNIKGIYSYAYDEVDRKKAWEVSSFLSKLPEKSDLVEGSLQWELYNYLWENEAPKKNFYLDSKAVYGKSEVDISDKNNNVKLTIDKDIEDKIRAVLSREEYKDLRNIGVTIMEANTGKIRGMVQKDESDANVNLGIEGSGYQPGSIFKLITLGTALDKGVVTLNDKFTCTGEICSLGVHGTITVKEALLKSCNDIYAKIGQKIGYEDIMNYAKKLGLYDRVLNIQGKGQNETAGIEPRIESGMNNISIGQSMTVSPLQMLGAINAIVNNGEYVKPQLIESIIDKNDKVIKGFETEKTKVYSSTTSKLVMNSMKDVVDLGTGIRAKVNGVELGGKTGSADNGSGNTINCWFSGYFKLKDKYYTMVVAIPDIKSEDSKGNDLGGSNTAAPIFGDIVKKLISN